MSTFKNKPELGNGIYTVPDLAQILNLPQSKTRRWLTDFYDQRLGAQYSGKYSWGDGRNKSTNFLTLIEFYVFYVLRDLEWSPRRILERHQFLKANLDTPYPFASSQLFVNKKDLLYAVDSAWIQTDKSNQIMIDKMIGEFFKKIDFSKNETAERFWPLGKDHKIVVDPHHQFGQPVIDGTNINASTIFSMYESGEPKETISILYDLTPEEVNDAIQFCKRTAA